MNSELRTLFIVGPTASGKTALSIALAKALDAEVVCADSQTVRKGMDIGTAKPTQAEMKGVPHYMLDIVEPFEKYSLSTYLAQARHCIQDIHARGKVAIVVGGTGLYVDALYFNFELPKLVDDDKDYSLLSVDELQALVQARGLQPPVNSQNPRHLVNVLKRANEGAKSLPDPSSVIIGIRPDREQLIERINKRVEVMFENGFIDEVRSLIKQYGKGEFDAIGYKIATLHLSSSLTEAEAKERFKIADRQYAKRQMSWFKRNPDIQWFDSPEAAEKFILDTYGS